jgi:glycosyltransferase involved in cell wall biosynthesis
MKVSFSVITVCLNSEKTIRATIDSVLQQTYKDFKLYFVDGASTDTTLEIIKSYQASNPESIEYISEPDKGLYDAMNKGIGLINDPNSFIIFLNSDDYFSNNSVLDNLAKHPEILDSDFIYGNVELITEGGFIQQGYKYNKFKLLRRTICHQAIFAKRKVFSSVGNFNLAYSIAADHEFVLKVFFDNTIKKTYMPISISRINTEGFAKKQFLKARSEYVQLLLQFSKKCSFIHIVCIYFFLIPRVYLLNIISFFGLEKFRKKIKYFLIPQNN